MDVVVSLWPQEIKNKDLIEMKAIYHPGVLNFYLGFVAGESGNEWRDIFLKGHKDL